MFRSRIKNFFLLYDLYFGLSIFEVHKKIFYFFWLIWATVINLHTIRIKRLLIIELLISYKSRITGSFFIF